MLNSNSGIFLLSAEKIYSEYVIPPKEIVTANNLLQYSNPMQCLLCFPISLFKSNNKNGILERISKYPQEGTIVVNNYENGLRGEESLHYDNETYHINYVESKSSINYYLIIYILDI